MLTICLWVQTALKAKGGESISALLCLPWYKPKKEPLNKGMRQGMVYRLRSHYLL